MALTVQDVQALARYARIELADDELEEMRAYLEDALALLEGVRSRKLDDVEPTFHPIGGLANVAAPDLPAPERSLGVDEALSNAASVRGRSFCVPAILADGGGGC